MLAVLTVIGGLDTRPRLGGLVQHEELGTGTIANIESKSKVVVLFHGRKSTKLCILGCIKPVSTVSSQPLLPDLPRIYSFVCLLFFVDLSFACSLFVVLVCCSFVYHSLLFVISFVCCSLLLFFFVVVCLLFFVVCVDESRVIKRPGIINYVIDVQLMWAGCRDGTANICPLYAYLPASQPSLIPRSFK